MPKFSLPDQHGNVFDISSVLGKKNIVLFFYPKDDTPGCTREACGFQDQHDRFDALDAVVVGISSDDTNSHKAFAGKFGLRFPLLSDPDNRVRKMFGVPTGIFGIGAGRVTFIVNKAGTIVHSFSSMMQAERHILESLKTLRTRA